MRAQPGGRGGEEGAQKALGPWTLDPQPGSWSPPPLLALTPASIYFINVLERTATATGSNAQCRIGTAALASVGYAACQVKSSQVKIYSPNDTQAKHTEQSALLLRCLCVRVLAHILICE